MLSSPPRNCHHFRALKHIMLTILVVCYTAVLPCHAIFVFYLFIIFTVTISFWDVSDTDIVFRTIEKYHLRFISAAVSVAVLFLYAFPNAFSRSSASARVATRKHRTSARFYFDVLPRVRNFIVVVRLSNRRLPTFIPFVVTFVALYVHCSTISL